MNRRGISNRFSGVVMNFYSFWGCKKYSRNIFGLHPNRSFSGCFC